MAEKKKYIEMFGSFMEPFSLLWNRPTEQSSTLPHPGHKVRPTSARPAQFGSKKQTEYGTGRDGRMR